MWYFPEVIYCRNLKWEINITNEWNKAKNSNNKKKNSHSTENFALFAELVIIQMIVCGISSKSYARILFYTMSIIEPDAETETKNEWWAGAMLSEHDREDL